MIMGRKSMDSIASMNLTPEQWPYGDMNIIVLSRTVKIPPTSFHSETEMYSGDIAELVKDLDARGYKHAYIDGGETITSFIELGLINEMTITQVPVLLGDGVPLFGNLNRQVKFRKACGLSGSRTILFRSNTLLVRCSNSRAYRGK